MTLEKDMQYKKIIQWGYDSLLSHGYTLKNNTADTIQNTPWSYVARFATSDGYIYLKHTPKLLALEAPITQILYDQFHGAVPKIIGHNAELDCFLMKDVGISLREVLKKQFNIALLCKAIDEFSLLQIAVADHENIFFDVGVPDWRLAQLPNVFKQLLLQKDILMADGLSEKEIHEVEMLIPTIIHLCKKLSDYAIKQTLVQCDFHDNNILINETTQKLSFIDLGEIVISHPFFSLIGCLRQAKKHHGLTEQDDAYQQLMNACFKNYISFESKERLQEAFAIAQVVWIIYEALGQYRLRLACDEAAFLSFQRYGRLSGSLQELIIACNNYK